MERLLRHCKPVFMVLQQHINQGRSNRCKIRLRRGQLVLSDRWRRRCEPSSTSLRETSCSILCVLFVGLWQVDRVVPVAGELDKKKFGYLFRTQKMQRLRDGHLWFSVFTRPPRSRYTRVERVTTCMALLYLSMLANCMWSVTKLKMYHWTQWSIWLFLILGTGRYLNNQEQAHSSLDHSLSVKNRSAWE